jgi:hypothetical protein
LSSDGKKIDGGDDDTVRPTAAYGHDHKKIISSRCGPYRLVPQIEKAIHYWPNHHNDQNYQIYSREDDHGSYHHPIHGGWSSLGLTLLLLFMIILRTVNYDSSSDNDDEMTAAHRACQNALTAARLFFTTTTTVAAIQAGPDSSSTHAISTIIDDDDDDDDALRPDHVYAIHVLHLFRPDDSTSSSSSSGNEDQKQQQ